MGENREKQLPRVLRNTIRSNLRRSSAGTTPVIFRNRREVSSFSGLPCSISDCVYETPVAENDRFELSVRPEREEVREPRRVTSGTMRNELDRYRDSYNNSYSQFRKIHQLLK